MRELAFTAATASAVINHEGYLGVVRVLPARISLDDAALLVNELIGGPGRLGAAGPGDRPAGDGGDVPVAEDHGRRRGGRGGAGCAAGGREARRRGQAGPR